MLRRLSPDPHPDLLVGALTGDDAAVWRLGESRALVFTADFITPVVDDARTWGRIAATNSVSDIYAMGGRPLLAVNLVMWNTAELTTELLGDVLAGGLDVARDNGFVIAGGHTVDDPEPKYGMAVIGEVDPRRMLTNTHLRVGDVLVLTKPLGIGVITTAIKRGECPESVQAAAIASMTRSNAEAARVALEAGATGATDVTGFGLLGHLGRMALESGVDVEIRTAAVPVIDGAAEMAAAGIVPGGSERNLDHVRDRLSADGIDPTTVLLLADAQTSGGLLFGVTADRVEAAISALRASGHDTAAIGAVIGPSSGRTAGSGALGSGAMRLIR